MFFQKFLMNFVSIILKIKLVLDFSGETIKLNDSLEFANISSKALSKHN